MPADGGDRLASRHWSLHTARMQDFYHPPVKRSVEIAGHKTSISLEPLFWDLLRQAATAEGVPLNALIARIDAERIAAERATGLAGAVRLWLTARLTARFATAAAMAT